MPIKATATQFKKGKVMEIKKKIIFTKSVPAEKLTNYSQENPQKTPDLQESDHLKTLDFFAYC